MKLRTSVYTMLAALMQASCMSYIPGHGYGHGTYILSVPRISVHSHANHGIVQRRKFRQIPECIIRNNERYVFDSHNGVYKQAHGTIKRDCSWVVHARPPGLPGYVIQ